MIEKIFESGLWATRFITLFAVVFSILGSIILFVVASVDIFKASLITYDYFFNAIKIKDFHALIVSDIIGAVDLYLIGIVLLIFGFGVYELFISDVDAAKGKGRVLSITSLDQLKDKVAKVIVMVLIVSFFQRILHTDYNGAEEMLYFAVSIAGISVSLYFLGKVGNH